MLLSVDPGLHKLGWALWSRKGELQVASLCIAPAAKSDMRTWVNMTDALYEQLLDSMDREGRGVNTLVCEMMQAYERNRSTTNHEDLLQLCGVLGALAHEFQHAEMFEYRPREWKGQVPKEICHTRALAKLSDEERARIQLPRDAKAKLDVLDAVALGLFHLKKEKKR